MPLRLTGRRTPHNACRASASTASWRASRLMPCGGTKTSAAPSRVEIQCTLNLKWWPSARRGCRVNGSSRQRCRFESAMPWDTSASRSALPRSAALLGSASRPEHIRRLDRGSSLRRLAVWPQGRAHKEGECSEGHRDGGSGSWAARQIRSWQVMEQVALPKKLRILPAHWTGSACC